MARTNVFGISSLPDEIKKQVEKYGDEIHELLSAICDEGVKKAKKEIEEFSDDLEQGEGHYRSMFTRRKKGDLNRILWNKKYTLSHLLENGHLVYNQYGGPYEIKNSKYLTLGKKTHEFDFWKNTEKNTAEYMIYLLNQSLK